jgi:signal transduction histidine kinase
MKIRVGPQKGSGPTGNLGLGLYIAERIVYAHGGRIEVEASEARGTTFTIHLPRSE